MLARRRGTAAALLALAAAAAAAAVCAYDATSSSIGTLAHCAEDAECLWVGHRGRAVRSAELRALLLAESEVGASGDAAAAARAERNLQQHMEYIEQVHRHAQRVGHTFSFQMGVTARHLLDESRDVRQRPELPEAFVHREMQSWRARVAVRHLTAAAVGGPGTPTPVTAITNTSLNWCSAENPRGRSVCSGVKSQKNCGSCWAFAATDAIETAVAIAANQSAAVALAPQQFLSCSRRETEETFTYCWAAGGVAYAPWLGETMKWKSANNGCAGGMTHGAFQDVVQLRLGLVTELEMPYDDKGSNASARSASISSLRAAVPAVCTRTSNQSAAASIADWKQAIGKDCSASRDPSVLLKRALQTQPIAVAVNSAYPFVDYKGGLYSCPHNGDLATKSDVNHALVLVGYGSDATYGDYWILKNSYGNAWGDNGFMKLLADRKANCGLTIFPVVPLGAQAGSAALPVVDGGGAKRFVGFALETWRLLAIATAVATAVLTAIGVLWSRRQRRAIRAQVSGAAAYVSYD